MPPTPFHVILRDAHNAQLLTAPLDAQDAAAAAAEAENICARASVAPYLYEVWQGQTLLRRALSSRSGKTLPIG